MATQDDLEFAINSNSILLNFNRRNRDHSDKGLLPVTFGDQNEIALAICGSVVGVISGFLLSILFLSIFIFILGQSIIPMNCFFLTLGATSLGGFIGTALGYNYSTDLSNNSY